jgi:SpoVK/Ycf46/Vps4 family AAA+-type ATPase
VNPTPETHLSNITTRFLEGADCECILVSSAPGMGKSALLSAVAGLAATAAVWIAGSVIASEGHFVELLSTACGFGDESQHDWRRGIRAVFQQIRTSPKRRIVLIIDDLDQLAFKREALVEALASELDETRNILLVGASHPSTADRLIGPGRAFNGKLRRQDLPLLDQSEADYLVRLRAPGVDPTVAAFLFDQAGGHPAALVFLSRLVELRGAFVTAEELPVVLNRAAEFAGAVYARQWYALGPQQRAILWRLASSDRSTASPTDLAKALHLPATHVGAQLKRLTDDGMVTRGSERGRYSVAPLLARWIKERAVSVPGVPAVSTDAGGVE